MNEEILSLAQALGITDSQLQRLQLKYRREHGDEADEKLCAWLKASEREMRDEALFLRAGTLPSDLGGRPGNPRATALSRGRTGVRRNPGKGRRRYHKQVLKPPTASQIEHASKQSAYIAYRDTLDAGSVVPADFQNVLVMEARGRFAEHRQRNAKEEHAEESARQVARQLRDLAVAIHRSGGDPVEFLASVQRQISEKRNELRDAA